MGYERYPRGNNPQGDNYGRSDNQDYGRDYSSGRDTYGGARDEGDNRGGYGSRDYGNQRYDQRDQQSGQQYGQHYGQRSGRDQGDRGSYGGGQGQRYGQSGEYHGSYASDGRRFEDVGRYRHADDDDYRQRDAGRNRQYGGQPQGYDYQDRGFIQRAGDEVRSWFGDDDANQRRDLDQRYDERYANRHDGDYHNWRSGQIEALDRDYDEYRRENRSKFENEFSSWRGARQGQRDLLSQVKEHLDVIGSDGEHVGTVDKVGGDRIVLTKSDTDAGGQHHSIPANWLQSVDGKVTLSKTAAEAKQQWQDEQRNQALFGDREEGSPGDRPRGTGKARATTY